MSQIYQIIHRKYIEMEIEYLRRIVNRKYAQVIYLIGGEGAMGFIKYSQLILSLIVYYFKNMRKNIHLK